MYISFALFFVLYEFRLWNLIRRKVFSGIFFVEKSFFKEKFLKDLICYKRIGEKGTGDVPHPFIECKLYSHIQVSLNDLYLFVSDRTSGNRLFTRDVRVK